MVIGNVYRINIPGQFNAVFLYVNSAEYSYDNYLKLYRYDRNYIISIPFKRLLNKGVEVIDLGPETEAIRLLYSTNEKRPPTLSEE